MFVENRSTFLAVLVIGFSKSYIFKTFFKALFLVTVVAGAHGLLLLPVLLSMFGGSNGEANPDDFRDEPLLVAHKNGGGSLELAKVTPSTSTSPGFDDPTM